MPAYLAAIAVFLAQIAGPLTARILGALGIGILSITGVEVMISGVISQIKSSFGGIPGDIISIATIAGFDRFLSLVVSAYIGIVSVKALFGAYKRFGFIGMGDD